MIAARIVGARPQVIMLPGAVLPAELAYRALLEALGDGVAAVAKELELYAGEEPSPGYALDVEGEGILRAAEASGFDRFHLVGYSGGGAASLAFAAKQPQRLRSLALLEPAWAGNEGLDPAEVAVWQEFDRIMALPLEERMPAFVRAQLAPSVEPPPPPPGPPPPWMAKRPAGVNAFIEACKVGGLDLDALRHLETPVYGPISGGLGMRAVTSSSCASAMTSWWGSSVGATPNGSGRTFARDSRSSAWS